MKIRLANKDVQPDSIVDGKGVRTVIWTQGCTHKCFGCHNPETHDCKGGYEVEIEEIIQQLDSIKNQTGITISGGDPMLQPEACLEIAKYAHSKDLDVWCYTGFTFEELINKAEFKPVYLELLNNIDVLVDGRFDINKKSYNTKFRGSSNQRIIDVKSSLTSDTVVLLDEYKEETTNQELYCKPQHVFV